MLRKFILAVVGEAFSRVRRGFQCCLLLGVALVASGHFALSQPAERLGIGFGFARQTACVSVDASLVWCRYLKFQRQRMPGATRCT